MSESSLPSYLNNADGIRLNQIIKNAVEGLSSILGGIWFVDEFQSAFDGHRFCENETDPNYHNAPIDDKTWFIHFKSPYSKFPPAKTSNPPFMNMFEKIDSLLIPPKNGLSTEQQICEFDGDRARINHAYGNFGKMSAALLKLAEDDPVENSYLPVSWMRIMHPKGSGYKVMADAVIYKILEVNGLGRKSSLVEAQNGEEEWGWRWYGRLQVYLPWMRRRDEEL
jgi:hypothetical protein